MFLQIQKNIQSNKFFISGEQDENFVISTVQRKNQAILEETGIDSDGRNCNDSLVMEEYSSEHLEYLPDSNCNSSDSCNNEYSMEIPKQFLKLEKIIAFLNKAMLKIPKCF